LTAAQLEQWDLLGDGSSGASIAVYSLPSLSTTFVSLETGAAAYSDMAFQIWTSFVSLRSTPPSACHGKRHLTQWMRTEMSDGREGEGGARAGGAYLNMMMLLMKVAQRAAPRADGERDEMGQLDGYEMRHPR
jgi:hypothetical protein